MGPLQNFDNPAVSMNACTVINGYWTYDESKER